MFTQKNTLQFSPLSFLADNCLEFDHQSGKIPTATDSTFDGECPGIEIPAGQQDNYKNCKVDKVYRNNIENGSMELLNQNLFTLTTKQLLVTNKCLKVKK